ncbi:hypothetical protein CDAR_547291 [Caerostris darwini]|uniref:Ribosomal protein L2 n=1 Tax=Caerostris darwini TaxID=1538125 RepID=A0AAV4QE94_9ARAC|nr:hypothetical protein CDAR_547291 [Caerostris darwini]
MGDMWLCLLLQSASSKLSKEYQQGKKNNARTPYGPFNRPPQGNQPRHSKPSLTTAKRGWKVNTRLPISFGVGYDDSTPRKNSLRKDGLSLALPSGCLCIDSLLNKRFYFRWNTQSTVVKSRIGTLLSVAAVSADCASKQD